jgi:hypothetical protein
MHRLRLRCYLESHLRLLFKDYWTIMIEMSSYYISPYEESKDDRNVVNIVRWEDM